MKKNIWFFVLLPAMMFCCFTAYPQKLHLNIMAGLANYTGDLQSKNFTLQQSHGAQMMKDHFATDQHKVIYPERLHVKHEKQ